MSLPPCPARRTLALQGDVFFCAHPRVHAKDQLVTEGVCSICTRWQEPPPAEYRPFPARPAQVYRGPCAHLGEQLRLAGCGSCRGTVRVKVFRCRHPDHQETTLAHCADCQDFAPLTASPAATGPD
jgi:hypothetical protein